MIRGVALVYAIYLLLPIGLLIIGSFGSLWTNTLLPTGVTGRWYTELWQDTSFRKAFVSSLTVASAACIINVFFGAAFSVQLVSRSKGTRQFGR